MSATGSRLAPIAGPVSPVPTATPPPPTLTATTTLPTAVPFPEPSGSVAAPFLILGGALLAAGLLLVWVRRASAGYAMSPTTLWQRGYGSVRRLVLVTTRLRDFPRACCYAPNRFRSRSLSGSGRNEAAMEFAQSVSSSVEVRLNACSMARRLSSTYPPK